MDLSGARFPQEGTPTMQRRVNPLFQRRHQQGCLPLQLKANLLSPLLNKYNIRAVKETLESAVSFSTASSEASQLQRVSVKSHITIFHSYIG
jgi:hypothetical protein